MGLLKIINEKELRDGAIIRFTNEEECVSLEITFRSSFRGDGAKFRTFFNGTFTKVAKNFKPILIESQRLIDKFDLVLEPEELV